MQAYRQNEDSGRILTDGMKAAIRAMPASMFQPKKVRKARNIMDHAQAKIKVFDAAENLCKQIGGTELAQMPPHCARLIVFLKAAMDQYRMTKQPKRVDEGDDFDSLHGCS